MRKIISLLISALLVGGLNFGMFLVAYRKLSFPYMSEEQRVANAPYIFEYVLPCFIVVAIFSVLAYIAASKLSNG
ncbi:hypothetical protein GCM10007932_20790 [Vibrio penaeicida]|uniref:DUF3955 domain-containing protein n=1 Tax=Vibrio penaeicida TaxID=104609 RepID=A0AAV5NQU3_9VIBR|nr:hypothetical protein GCM10007932_20790 [Vibrio penaeicida]